MSEPDAPIISSLLEATVDTLDLTPDQFERAVALYEDLGEWLVEYGIGDPDVYPQGSFRLGTVLRPNRESGFDIDLVFLRPIAKTSVTQAELRAQAKELLDAYIAERGDLNGSPELEEKGRCWTLVYPDDEFHMDVVPVIPDDDGAPEAVLLSDRDLREWQHSNPIGYADWFWNVMGDTVAVARARLGKALAREVEDVPRWLVRTPLQRAVQLLKLHRDEFFADNPGEKPPSILITTLAGRAYGGDVDVYETYRKVAAGLASAIEIRDGEWWVPNPAHEEENFADKWNTHDGRKAHFDAWVSQLLADVESWDRPNGIDAFADVVGRSLGEGPVRAAAATVAQRFAAAAAASTLSVTESGRVGTGSAIRPVRRHDFYGE